MEYDPILKPAFFMSRIISRYKFVGATGEFGVEWMIKPDKIDS